MTVMMVIVVIVIKEIVCYKLINHKMFKPKKILVMSVIPMKESKKISIVKTLLRRKLNRMKIFQMIKKIKRKRRKKRGSLMRS